MSRRSALVEALKHLNELSVAEQGEVLEALVVSDLFKRYFVLIPLKDFKELRKQSDFGVALAKYMRNRKVGLERLARGIQILEDNRSGVSWKNMPAHVLEKHPDWFPEYVGNKPTGKAKKQFEERLRRMARDAKKHEPDEEHAEPDDA